MVQSSTAASWIMRHAKGNGRSGCGPKFKCIVTLRYATAGNSALPLSASGSGCGFEARTPPLNKLTVSRLGLSGSRFKTTATTSPWPNFSAILFLFPGEPLEKMPSESKHTASAVSRKSEAPAVAKPTRTCRNFIMPEGRLELADWLLFSTMATSYMYRPAVRPTLARAPASRYWKPPSLSDIRSLPSRAGMTLSVVSSAWKVTAPVFNFARVSDGSSPSTSVEVFMGSAFSSPAFSSTASWGGLASASCFGAIS
mmetsp:Transcript_47979/g.133821  ORF Transcript_47979/g.133821 Transcript_47979/m.133821 type:complete len:255 (+) Transcript_47979:2033-2797(+)